MSDDRTRGPSGQAVARLESPDVATSRVLGVAAGLAVFLAVSLAAVWVFYVFAVGRPKPPAPAAFSLPRLQTDNGADELRHLRDAENAKLNSYGWIDHERKLVRVPIARAMDAVVARGDHAYDPLIPTSGETAAGTHP
jgi:hypothetical protein